jgi:predicted ABC-type ATPase
MRQKCDEIEKIRREIERIKKRITKLDHMIDHKKYRYARRSSLGTKRQILREEIIKLQEVINHLEL